jgi:hypothetical protein
MNFHKILLALEIDIDKKIRENSWTLIFLAQFRNSSLDMMQGDELWNWKEAKPFRRANPLILLTMYAFFIIFAYMEVFMPLLQVRDFPDDLYETLSKVSAAENRSISQETIVLLRKALNFQQERLSRRKRILEEIQELNFIDTDDFPNPANLIREERDR